MKVFKCDRCGGFYDKQKKDALYLVGKFNYINKDVATSGTYNYIDLCDSCLAELDNWMAGGCNECRHFKKSWLEEPCNRCKNAYVNKFKPRE